MKVFQTVLIVVFIFSAFVGLLIFGKGSSGKPGSSDAVLLNVWGTIPQNYFQGAIDAFAKTNSDITVIYTFVPESGFYENLVEAIASGHGPDAFALSDSLSYQLRDKILPFPIETLSVETYKGMFLSACSNFIYGDGVLAIPITIDPLVLYYNRDILEANSIAYPPKSWQEMLSMSQTLTKKNDKGEILQSTIGIGEYQNVRNARDILTMLSFQGGTKITMYKDAKLQTSADFGQSTEGLTGALAFYTNFANPNSSSYSWNLSFDSDRSRFLEGKSAFYLGFGSELFEMRDINPNLNFDIAKIPQLNSANPVQVKNYAKVFGMAVAKQANHSLQAYQFVASFANPEVSKSVVDFMNQNKLSIASPLRALSTTRDAKNPYVGVIYDMSIISDTFSDPNFTKTSQFFKDAIVDVNSSRSDASTATDIFFRNLKSFIR